LKIKPGKLLLIGLIILLILAGGLGVLYSAELRTLASFSQLDDHPLYQMRYHGDYGFDQFLETGAENDGDIEDFVTGRLLKGLPVNLSITGAGCTAFITRNERGEVIYGRNFDFDYTPSLQLFTAPPGGFKSVSTVNLSYAGYHENHLPDGVGLNRFFTLASPFLAFDGMNEKGVAMALLAVPEADYIMDDAKVTLNTTTVIRLVLDQAANVTEAVELLGEYNIYFSGDIYCHYLIADAAGDSVIVEYWDGQIQTVTSPADYQIASNFVAYQGLNIGEGYDEFERYNFAEETLKINEGILTEGQAIELLAELGVYYENEDKLQWSVLYNLNTLEGKIFTSRNTDNIIDFALE